MRGRYALHALEGFQTTLSLPRLAGCRAKALDERLHVPDVALLPGEQRRLLRKFRGSLLFECGIVAAVGARCGVFQVHDAVHDGIEELTVVSDEQQGARISPQPLFEPQNGIQIEMVRGLIEQQEVRAAHQRLRNIEPYSPTAREGTHWALLVRRSEAKPVHQAPGAAARVITADRRILRMQFGQAAAVVAFFRIDHGTLDRSELGVAVENKLDRRSCRGQQLLRDVCDAKVRRHLERSGVRLQIPTHQGQKAGLAAAVLARDSDLFTAKQAESSAREQHARAAANRDVGKVEHGSERLTIPCGCRNRPNSTAVR